MVNWHLRLLTPTGAAKKSFSKIASSDSSDKDTESEPPHLKIARKKNSKVVVTEATKFKMYTDDKLRAVEGSNEMPEKMKHHLCQCTCLLYTSPSPRDS